MASRKENADLIGKKFGVTIDTEKSDPKAPVLQSWADRLENDSASVEREVLSFQLQSKLGIDLADQMHDTATLRAWLDRSETEPDLVKAELQPTSTDTLELEPGDGFGKDEKTFQVSVVEAVAAFGGTVTDPEQPAGSRVIGSEPVKVRDSQVVATSLKNGTLQRI